ncbi:MAG: GTPase Era [Acidimicrobiia bacterium]|nr:GTPase Era [Acidimicrobiia bacterium]
MAKNGDAVNEFRSGFVSLLGRPNVGKSTLVNALVGTKVSITSPRPQTTRTQIRGVRTTTKSQIVLLDTPGIHKPRTLLGERCNRRSVQTLTEVDVVCLLIEANEPIGSGDKFISDLIHKVDTPRVLVVNKTDASTPSQVVEHLGSVVKKLGEFDAYLPLSAKTGDGLEALVAEFEGRIPEGPVYYPDGVVSDQAEALLVAELLREKLLAMAREELPHSIMVTAAELETDEEDEGEHDPDVMRYRVVVHVERDSQKGIVIGKGGTVIRDAGMAARLELESLFGARVYLETHVKVDKDWQRRAQSLDRLGL